MRHRCAHRKFSRSPAHRRALFRNMLTSFFEHERLSTTLPKAKELRSEAEKCITLARKDTLHARRRAYSYLYNKKVVHKLFADIAPRYKDRPGGYTRILKTGVRLSDASEMAVIELVDGTAALPKKLKANKEVKKKDSSAAADDAAKAEIATGDRQQVEKSE